MRPGLRFFAVHRLAATAVAVLGFCAMGLGGELGGAGGAAAVLAVLASLWPGRPQLPSRLWVGLQLAFLAWLGVQWVLMGAHVLTLFASLLMFVQIHRLLTRRGTRDDLYSSFIAFGQLLLASVLTVDVMYFVVFMAFVFAVVQVLLLSRMALAAEEDWRAATGLRDVPVPASAYGSLDRLVRVSSIVGTSALAAGIQVGTLVLFFVLPRTQAAVLGGILPPLHVSGFSDRVRLGAVGTMQLSRDPVMRVKVSTADGEPFPGVASLYWHGLALDRFDGAGWELSDARRTTLAQLGGRQGRAPPQHRSWSLKQEITLEPLDSAVLFHVPDAAGIYGDFSTLEAVETDGFYLPGQRSRRDYTVYSEPRAADLERLREQEPRRAPDHLLTPYTQLPTDLSPRIGELAREWGEGGASTLDTVLLLQDHLRSSFVYSLDQEPSRYPDPLLAFLDDVQEGHCEYFASGLAVMLRTMGVPARIVNGFAGAEWNPVGEYWVVRQLHAHSWVEVWFPDDGWIIFDPTPTGQTGASQARLSMAGQLRAWADFGRVTWGDIMLDYGLDTQVEGLRAGLSSLGQLGSGEIGLRDLLGDRPPGEDDERGSGSGRAWLAVVLVALGAGGVVVLGRRRGRDAGLDPQLRRARALLDRLEARWTKASGGLIGPEWTPLAQARWAAHVDAERFGRAPEIVDRWYGARFGSEPLPGDLLDDLAGLAKTARGWRPPPPTE